MERFFFLHSNRHVPRGPLRLSVGFAMRLLLSLVTAKSIWYPGGKRNLHSVICKEFQLTGGLQRHLWLFLMYIVLYNSKVSGKGLHTLLEYKLGQIYVQSNIWAVLSTEGICWHPVCILCASHESQIRVFCWHICKLSVFFNGICFSFQKLFRPALVSNYEWLSHDKELLKYIVAKDGYWHLYSFQKLLSSTSYSVN